MKARCKGIVTSVTKYGNGVNGAADGATITLNAIGRNYNDPDSEDNIFVSATPSFELKMHIKTVLAEQFTPGKRVYIDFSAAE